MVLHTRDESRAFQQIKPHARNPFAHTSFKHDALSYMMRATNTGDNAQAADLFFLAGMLYLNGHQEAEAESCFDAVRRKEPDYDPSNRNLGYGRPFSSDPLQSEKAEILHRLRGSPLDFGLLYARFTTRKPIHLTDVRR